MVYVTELLLEEIERLQDDLRRRRRMASELEVEELKARKAKVRKLWKRFDRTVTRRLAKPGLSITQWTTRDQEHEVLGRRERLVFLPRMSAENIRIIESLLFHLPDAETRERLGRKLSRYDAD